MNIQTRKPAAERMAEIVETTIRLSAEIGPDRLTTEHIAKAIGVSQAAIFRHFKTKNDIWVAVGQRVRDLVNSSALPVVGTSKMALLTASVAGQLDFISKTPAVPAILFSRELHTGNEALRLFFQEMMKQRHGKLTQIITEGIKAGEFSQDLNAADAAYLILALIQGLAMRWSLNARSFDLRDEGERLFKALSKSFF